MPNSNARKGSAYESAVKGYLSEVFGRQVRRPRQEGHADVGDLHLSPFALQAKNYANTTEALNVGVRSAEVQAARAEEPYGAAVIKKRQAPVAESRVAMTLRTFRRVVARLRRAEALLAHHAPSAYAEHLRQIEDDR